MADNVKRIRLRGQPAHEAEEALARVYQERQLAAVDDTIRTISAAGPDARGRGGMVHNKHPDISILGHADGLALLSSTDESA